MVPDQFAMYGGFPYAQMYGMPYPAMFFEQPKPDLKKQKQPEEWK